MGGCTEHFVSDEHLPSSVDIPVILYHGLSPATRSSVAITSHKHHHSHIPQCSVPGLQTQYSISPVHQNRATLEEIVTSWIHQIFSQTSTTMVTWFTPGSGLGTNAAVSLIPFNIMHFYKLLSGICRTAPKPVLFLCCPWWVPARHSQNTWVQLPGSNTQKLMQAVKLLHGLLRSSLITT